MDLRWNPVSRDSRKDVRVILHPTAGIWDVRRGLDPGSDDSVDVSEFVTQGNHTAFDANITLNFNRELFGTNQPKPNQVLEIQYWQNGEWKPIWLGIIDAISAFTLQRGERSMQLIAKTRDQQDIWRNTKRITPLFPQLTNLTYIIQRVARSASMKGDEIVLPNSAFTTAHSSTQLADMNAWDMIVQMGIPLGWTPFIDTMGRLRVADRTLQNRTADIQLEDGRLLKVGGQRQRPPKSRVRVNWLNPTMKKQLRQGQMLSTETITLGWFLPVFWKHVYWSTDKTQRAEGTYPVIKQSCNSPWSPRFVRETYIQQTQVGGKWSFTNIQLAAMATLIATNYVAHMVPDPVAALGGGATVPQTPGSGSFWQWVSQASILYVLSCVGTGVYEVWGMPFDWVHARNTSEAFDSSVPEWVDNTVDIDSDFIANEEHAKAVAIRELIYQAREANKWGITIVDDPRIEYGDILEFVDGNQLYVEDFSRSLERGSEATLDVKGFLIPVTNPAGQGSFGGDIPPVIPGGGGGDPGGGGGGGEEGGGGESGGGGTKNYQWDWHDQTPEAPPPHAPDPSGPQSMGAWQDYFFQITGQKIGDPANDFNAVLMDLVSKGAKVNPGENEKPQTSWAFHGLAVMVSGGEARGRIWLPTAESYIGAGKVWWTHEMQVIRDAPAKTVASKRKLKPPVR
jgi:uncharacterized membrane protein YgcG